MVKQWTKWFACGNIYESQVYVWFLHFRKWNHGCLYKTNIGWL